MSRGFGNVYDDQARARAYAALEFPGTYYLAFRDIPAILARHAAGRAALDFGCGAGRSTRFLREHGCDALGADISAAMLREARARDPDGEYIQVVEGDLGALGERTFDLVFSAFTFDNIPTRALRSATFAQLRQRLKPRGRMINLVSSPQIYRHEWVSFSTRDFPENCQAAAGDVVRIVMLDVPDRRPVEDILWTEAEYRETYAAAGLEVLEVHRPLGRGEEPFAWVSEERVAPWTIFVLGRHATSP